MQSTSSDSMDMKVLSPDIQIYSKIMSRYFALLALVSFGIVGYFLVSENVNDNLAGVIFLIFMTVGYVIAEGMVKSRLRSEPKQGTYKNLHRETIKRVKIPTTIFIVLILTVFILLVFDPEFLSLSSWILSTVFYALVFIYSSGLVFSLQAQIK